MIGQAADQSGVRKSAAIHPSVPLAMRTRCQNRSSPRWATPSARTRVPAVTEVMAGADRDGRLLTRTGSPSVFPILKNRLSRLDGVPVACPAPVPGPAPPVVAAGVPETPGRGVAVPPNDGITTAVLGVGVAGSGVAVGGAEV